MKTLFIALIVLSAPTLTAQPDATLAREKMKLFTDWPGTWKGEGLMRREGARPSRVEEQIQFKLDGLMIMFEGTGKTTDAETKQEKTVHSALGLLTYDTGTQQYKMKSYLADGKSTDAWFVVLGPNHYQWGFDANPGKIKYTITIDLAGNKKTWKEVGEYSRDGNAFAPFFEMNLMRD